MAIALLVALLAPMSLHAAARSQAAKDYDAARRLYFALQSDAQKQRFRHHWTKVIAAFRSVVADHPQSPEAPRAAYTTAELWSDLYRISRRPSDLDQAIEAYALVVDGYPKSSLADDALWQQANIELERRGHKHAAAKLVATLLSRYPRGDMAPRAKDLATKLPAAKPQRVQTPGTAGATQRGVLVGRREEGGQAEVTHVRQWSAPGYSRVVIYLDGPAQARTQTLAADPRQNAPERLVVDVERATLAGEVPDSKAVDDALVESVRIAQHSPHSVRVVFDLKHPAAHRAMVMENPYRVVVDVLEKSPSASEELVTEAPLVVIDAGHGGKDGGASGPDGVLEKNVVLSIAQRVAKLLEARGVRVLLTRKDDTFIPLEERTALANRAGADLFISVHANSHRRHDVRGIETYYLNVTDDRYALRLAALENQTNEEQVGDVQLILADLSIKATTDRSKALARAVQSELITTARAHKVESRDLGVKPSLFYVLLGARMPAVLVETSFISNPTEEKLLTMPRYQDALAGAIAKAAADALDAAGKRRTDGGRAVALSAK